MDRQENGGTYGTRSLQVLDPSALPQVQPASGVPESMVPPTYEEALVSPKQIIIQDSYISAVYAPQYPPAYPCDHQPSRECSFCSTPRRCTLSSRGDCRPRRRLTHRDHSCPRILIFTFIFMFFLIMTSVMYNLILVEPYLFPDWCAQPSCAATTPKSN